MKVRRRTVVVEATQLTEAALAAHLLDGAKLPDGVHVSNARYHRVRREVWSASCSIRTRDGYERIEPGAWIIRDETGCFSAVAAEDFHALYESAE